MSRLSDYQDAVAAGGFTLAPRRIELTNYDGVVLATNRSDLVTDEVIHWKVTPSELTFTPGSVSQRSLTLDVVGDDERLIPFPGSALHPDSQNRVRFYAGIILADGTEVSRAMATMLVDDADVEDSHGVVEIQVNLVDLLHPVRSDLEHSFDLVGGELVSSAVGRLLAQVLPDGSYLVEGSGYTIPGNSTLTPGTARMSTVTQLLMGCGQELVTSEEGLVYVREILSSDDDPNMERWLYGPGGIPVERIKRSFGSRTAEAWKIEGGNFTSGNAGQTIVVYDRDERSEGFWSPTATHRHIGSTRLPWVGGVRQAAVAAYAQIRANSSGPGVAVLVVPPNPFIKEGDLLELTSERLREAGLYRVTGFKYPDGAALMEVTVRRVFNPALDYEFPLDRGEGCLLAATDPFERGSAAIDQPDASAGLDWVSFGRGWRTQDGRAQQFEYGWAGAVLNTPMCSLDHSASFYISLAPAGTAVGVLVRSSGEWDGYSATIDGNGVIRLEVWLAGRVVATLAEVATEGSSQDKVLALTAVGSALSVEYGSDVVISTNDDRRNGNHVGLVGKNPDGYTPPQVGYFNASEAT